MLASAWILVLPINDNAWWWMLKAGVAAGFSCVIQDNHDVEGDRTLEDTQLPYFILARIGW